MQLISIEDGLLHAMEEYDCLKRTNDMNQVSDKEIIEYIKNKRYSNLSFLDDCWKSSENEWVLGFYYLVLDLKQENYRKVFDEIVSRYGSESSAYLYLGKTAQEIFSSFGEQ